MRDGIAVPMFADTRFRNGMLCRRRRFMLVCVLGLAFVLQTLVVQTHLHLPRPNGGELAQTFGLTVSHHHQGKPVDGDDDGDHDEDCPFCQTMLAAGGYLTPSIPAILPPMRFAHVRQSLPPTRMYAPAPRHGWSSRAPPQPI